MKAGILTAPPKRGSHEAIVATYSDDLLEVVIADLGRRNLRDYRDHETRFCAERLSASRTERKLRRMLINAR